MAPITVREDESGNNRRQPREVRRQRGSPATDEGDRGDRKAARRRFHAGGRCIAGPYTGQVVSAITFPDGAGFGRALDSMLADPEYQRFVAEVVKDSELQDRWIIVAEEF